MADTEILTCNECGTKGLKGPMGVATHWQGWCEKNPEAKKHQEKLIAGKNAASGASTDVRSTRGLERRGFQTRTATSLEQIRDRPGGLVGGPSSYYINPRGATISEALIVSPNGAPVMNNAGRDVGGSVYHQNRQKDRGYEYVGPTLTREGAKRLEQATVPIDADAMVQELNDIAAAHKLASMPAGLLDVIRTVAGDAVSANVEVLAAKIGGAKNLQDASGLNVAVTNAGPDDF